MTRYKLTIEYDGRPFVGWQRQANGPSIQQSLETAIERFCGETTVVHGAGRTDAGVHALGQVAHVDISRSSRTDVIRDAINHHLRPAPIAVVAAELAPDDFNARTWAQRRRYLYRLINRRAPLVLDRGLAWQVQGSLDLNAMRQGANALIGHHDFTSFRSSECQANSPMRTLDDIAIRTAGHPNRDTITGITWGDDILVDVAARSFLHNQVRIIVGTLVKVAQGRWPVEQVARALAARDRAEAGPTAPADGLYFAEVTYPPAPDSTG